MASAKNVSSETEVLDLDLGACNSATERDDRFWNSSVVSMKFSIEPKWIKSVRKARRKPNYGMSHMDSQLEEVVGNKLELAGPLIDSYLKEIGSSLKCKLSRSKATGLVNPITLFIPWTVFRHIMTLARGYSGDVHTNQKGTKHYLSFPKMDTVKKLFSPARFCGETFFAYRHFKKEKCLESQKLISVYNGRSTIVVSELTPFCIDYNMKNQRASLTFYIQRYSANDYAIDAHLQSLMNSQ